MDNVLNDINHTTVEGLGFKNVTINLFGVDVTDVFVKGGLTVKISPKGAVLASDDGIPMMNLSLSDLKKLSKKARPNRN